MNMFQRNRDKTLPIYLHNSFIDVLPRVVRWPFEPSFEHTFHHVLKLRLVVKLLSNR